MKQQSALDLKTEWLTIFLPKLAGEMDRGKRLVSGMRAMAVDTAGLDLTEGLAIGITKQNGGGFAMALHVERRSMAESDVVEKLRKQAGGELVVRITGHARTMAGERQQGKVRPLEPGLSVSHVKVTAGTLGGFAEMKGDPGGVHILSNNHVLANENASRLGDAIVQPGSLDGGKAPRDTVALLSARKLISFKKPNRCDGALARLVEGTKYTGNRFLGIGLLKGIKEAEPGMKVLKVGRTTGLTHGKINDIEVDQRYVSFGKGDARFDGIISVESAKKGQPFCDGGDSGSLIISEHGYAVGLLFAGTDFGGAFDQGLTYANRIQDVLKILKAELIMG